VPTRESLRNLPRKIGCELAYERVLWTVPQELPKQLDGEHEVPDVVVSAGGDAGRAADRRGWANFDLEYRDLLWEDNTAAARLQCLWQHVTTARTALKGAAQKRCKKPRECASVFV